MNRADAVFCLREGSRQSVSGVLNQTMSLGNSSSSPLYVPEAPEKGRGVFAREEVAAGTLIESAPVVVIPAAERGVIDAAGRIQVSVVIQIRVAR